MVWEKAREDWADEFEGHALSMLDLYCKTLSDLGYDPVPYPDIDERVGSSVSAGGKFDALNHAHWMCREARGFIRQNRREKAYRWIGTIQGILWLGGVFSIAELRKHNELPPEEWGDRRKKPRQSSEGLLRPSD
ncbi:MAG: hypothetical protein C0418_03380 [Coriobacteriaceae bacterium]|nr:hypothetical protein [Coriobacteriaceae bacterium]